MKCRRGVSVEIGLTDRQQVISLKVYEKLRGSNIFNELRWKRNVCYRTIVGRIRYVDSFTLEYTLVCI